MQRFIEKDPKRFNDVVASIQMKIIDQYEKHKKELPNNLDLAMRRAIADGLLESIQVLNIYQGFDRHMLMKFRDSTQLTEMFKHERKYLGYRIGQVIMEKELLSYEETETPYEFEFNVSIGVIKL